MLQAMPTAKIVFSCEIDKYARQIYKKNFGVEPYEDIREINAADVPEHDIFVAGFPCQDVSIAGKREGLCGARSGMFFEIIRILREKQPRIVFLENVRGLFSSNRGWDFARVLIEMENVGYTCEWQVFNSKNHGVPQNRERVFIIGHLRGAGTRPIFPITENNRPANDVQGLTTNTVTTRYGKSYAVGSYIIENRLNTSALNNPTHSNNRIYDPSGVSPALNCAEGGNRQPLIICDSGQGREDQIRSDAIAPLRANTGAGHNNIVVPEMAGCLTGGGHSGGHHSDMAILKTICGARRLTPVECERLQGFPDGWTGHGTKVLNTVQIYGNVWDQILVQSMGAIEKLSTVNRDCVLCTINDGKDGEIQISRIRPNEKINRCVILMDVVAPHIVEKCVCDIISHGNDTVIHYNHKGMLKLKKENLKNRILESMGGNYTKPLLRLTLDEKLEREKSSTILTWIKEIMECQTFIYAKTDRPITDAIIHWSSVPQNLSEKDSLFLKMENIIKISDTQRYKCLGNAVTVNVVEFITKHIMKMLLKERTHDMPPFRPFGKQAPAFS